MPAGVFILGLKHATMVSNMRIIESLSCDQALSKAADFIAGDLSVHAKNGAIILWLVSGGSSIDVAVAVQNKLDIGELKQVTVAQVDERFVPPGSQEENWQQLVNQGFELSKFRQTVSILSCGNSLLSASQSYNHILGQLMEQSTYKIGLFGVGPDGHTGGIKPVADRKAFKPFLGPELIVGYQADDFSRITITAAVIKRLDSGVLYACGENKKPVIAQLNTPIPAHAQPVQLLNQIPVSVVFS